MLRSSIVVSLVLGAVLVWPAAFAPQASAMAPSKGRPKPVHALKVMVRHPGPVYTRYPSKATANSAANMLKRAGWKVKVRAVRGAFLTEARMPRWKQYGLYTNPAMAQQAVYVCRMRGFQVNVLKVN